MTTEASPPGRRGPTTRRSRDQRLRRRRRRGGLGLTAAAIRVDGLVLDVTFWVLLLLAVLAWWSGRRGRAAGSRLSFTSIVLLAAMALVGPAGAGHRGHHHRARSSRGAPAARRGSSTRACSRPWGWSAVRVRRRRRVPRRRRPVGTWQIVRHVGIPILVADVVQLVVNLVLLAVVIRLAAGMPMRTQIGRLLGTSGPAHLGYGVIAFILVVLWEPGGAGLGERLPHPPAARSWPSGPTASTPRSSRGTSGPSTCSWPRSRPRRLTSRATAPGSPS